jgi:predicted DNA-binding protein (UPF0251 family)
MHGIPDCSAYTPLHGKTDFRSRGRAIQEALRTQGVYLVRQVGKTEAEAAEAVGVSRQVVNRWLKRHAEGGEEALLDGRRVSPRKGKMIAASNARAMRLRPTQEPAWAAGHYSGNRSPLRGAAERAPTKARGIAAWEAPSKRKTVRRRPYLIIKGKKNSLFL